MNREEMLRLEVYLKEKLNPGITVVKRKEASDSAALYLDKEFIATVYKDTDEGEVSYSLTMTVLAEDLPV